MGSSIAVLGLLALALAAALVAMGWRVKNLRGRLNEAAGEGTRARETLRELSERERKASKALEACREEIESLKHELGAQKKKNHVAQEEMKKVRAELRDTQEEVTRVRDERPAFETKPPTSDAKPAKAASVPAAPTAPAASPTALATEMTVELAAQRARLSELAQAHQAFVQRLAVEEQGHAQARAEVARIRKRIEDYRRIDLVGKGKVAVLEDRLRTMGRQYYDAVSELAVLKGEVQPPPLGDLPPERDDGLGSESDDAPPERAPAAPRPE